MPNRQQASETWYQRLVRWITAYIRKEKRATQSPRILKEWSSLWGKMFLLVRNTPEAVDNATYRFFPSYYHKISLLLTCDRYRPIRTTARSSSGYRLQGLRDGTPTYGHPIPTHRISLAKLTETPGFAAIETDLLWSYPVDFCGSRVFEADSDRYAKIITAELALLLLKQEYERINWELQIHLVASKHVDSNHEILSRK